MNSSNKFSKLLGLIIVLLGVILLLNNLNITDVSTGEIISTYWPVLIIFWGIDNLITNKNNSQPTGNKITTGIILILGIVILGRNLGFFVFILSIIWKLLWPLVFIFLGLSILKGSSKTSSTNWAFMSGLTRKNNTWKLSSTSYRAIMGGIELDLSTAEISDGKTYLDLTAFMGGIEIKIPEELNVKCNNISLLGGIDFFQEDSGGIIVNRSFEHNGDKENNQQLIINSRTIMGGIEIKEV